MAKKSTDKMRDPRGGGGEARVEYVRLDKLPAWPKNPKKHNVQTLKESLMRWGFVAPVILDEGTGRLVAGHGRCETAEALRADGSAPPQRVKVDKDGQWMIPVLRGLSFASEQEAEAYLLADNRTNEIGGWDDQLLKEMLQSIQATGDEDLQLGLGWNDKEINALIRSVDTDRATGPSPAEKLDSYTSAAIKQLVLFFDSETYDTTVARFHRVMEHAKLESHTDVVLKLLDLYEVEHADSLGELETMDVDEAD